MANTDFENSRGEYKNDEEIHLEIVTMYMESILESAKIMLERADLDLIESVDLDDDSVEARRLDLGKLPPHGVIVGDLPHRNARSDHGLFLPFS